MKCLGFGEITEYNEQYDGATLVWEFYIFRYLIEIIWTMIAFIEKIGTNTSLYFNIQQDKLKLNKCLAQNG